MILLKKTFPLFLVITIIFIGGDDTVGASESNKKENNRNDVTTNEKAQATPDDYYIEKYRPQFHFSTPTGRLADPNGLVFFEEEYHLFHQKMGTWAHAVSKDMVSWEHLPVALEHDELGQALSGSVVVDQNDTTGLFDGEAGMVAIYTNTEGGEAQSIAYSKDKGRTWERYDGNPVIENPDIKDFRDPKVFWHEETEKWIMVVSTDQSVTFYNSDNLINWDYQSSFGDEDGSHVAVWECPDLFRLPVDGDENNQKWVLHVSIGDNPETEGSTTQYFTGTFDGIEFINDNPPETVLTTDFGQDFYAAQSFSGIDEKEGREIWLGWMANWRYPYQSPTEPWMGSMSIPRQLSLKKNDEGEIRLFQEPIQELESIRANHYSEDPFTLDDSYEISEFFGTTYEFEAEVDLEDVDEFGIRLRQSESEETIVGINTEMEEIFLDRSKAGLETLIDRDGNPFQFGKRFKAKYPAERKTIKIHGFVDESSVELFINDGEYVFTNLIYTDPTSKGIELYTKSGSVNITSLDFYHLNSIWRDVPGEGEIDRIVVNDEDVELEVGESMPLTAHVKPDWLTVTEPMQWEPVETDLIDIDEVDNSTVMVTGVHVGLTTLTVRDPDGKGSNEITVNVLEDKQADYINGWGPSPVTGVLSGKWDIIDESNVTSHVAYSPDWKEIYREEILTGDFSVSADIEWLNQGDEGYPKYGITIVDEDGTVVLAFLNIAINQLETFAKDKNRDLDWEGVDLTKGTSLQKPQTLSVEKIDDTFIFYFNGEKMHERTLKMEGDMSIGLINENTSANFTNFNLKDTNNDGDSEEDDKESDYEPKVNGNSVDGNAGEGNEDSDISAGELPIVKNTIADELNDSNDADRSYNIHAADSDRTNKGEKLPTTATNIFNILLVGFGFILVGLIAWYFTRKKDVSQKANRDLI